MKTNKTNSKKNLGRVVHRPDWLLWFGFLIRAVHQIGAAVFLCSYLLPELTTIPRFYLWLAITSGALLLFTEAFRHREMHREVSGILTFVKLLLLGAAFHQLLPISTTVITAFFLASIGAHLPKTIRHRLLF